MSRIARRPVDRADAVGFINRTRTHRLLETSACVTLRKYYGWTATSLCTEVTPSVLLAIMVAKSTASWVGARPLSQTTPFSSVSTLIRVNVLMCFAANFVFTFVVITESLTTWWDASGAVPASSASTIGAHATPAVSMLASMMCFIIFSLLLQAVCNSLVGFEIFGSQRDSTQLRHL